MALPARDLGDRLDRRAPDTRVLILQERSQRVERTGVGNVTESPGAAPANVGVAVADSGNEWLDRGSILQLAKRGRRASTDIGDGSLSAAASPAAARASPISPSAAIARSRTVASVSFSASISPGTARALRSCPSAAAACRLTPASLSFSAPTRPSTAPSEGLCCAVTSRDDGPVERRMQHHRRGADEDRARFHQGPNEDGQGGHAHLLLRKQHYRTCACGRPTCHRRPRRGACLSSELTERERRLLADVGVGVLQRGRQPIEGARIAELTERERDLLRTSATVSFTAMISASTAPVIAESDRARTRPARGRQHPHPSAPR